MNGSPVVHYGTYKCALESLHGGGFHRARCVHFGSTVGSRSTGPIANASFRSPASSIAPVLLAAAASAARGTYPRETCGSGERSRIFSSSGMSKKLLDALSARAMRRASTPCPTMINTPAVAQASPIAAAAAALVRAWVALRTRSQTIRQGGRIKKARKSVQTTTTHLARAQSFVER
jgi:hypothetical protein